DLDYLSGLLDANPTWYLDELQEKLYASRGPVASMYLSIAALSRTIRRLAITKKTVAPEAIERNELLRATWQAVNGDIPMEYFVWLDE
ncbi:hypothetical protein B0H11DRAFT_1680230, partial [Mycena galericulata]